MILEPNLRFKYNFYLKWFEKNRSSEFIIETVKAILDESLTVVAIKDKITILQTLTESKEPVALDALFLMGNFYEDGIYLSKDIKQAIKFYQLAAAKEYTPAENKLGNCYYIGIGIKKD